MRFLLNGIEILYEDDPTLTLRDYLMNMKICSYSLPCCNGDGECGACTLLLDEKAVLPCKVSMEKVMYKSIVTPDKRERIIQDVFSSMLYEAGPPQCKNCIPDMMMTARIFLKKNPDPTFEQALRAITKHLCTCVGRPRLAKALLNTAAILDARGHGAVEKNHRYIMSNQ